MNEEIHTRMHARTHTHNIQLYRTMKLSFVEKWMDLVTTKLNKISQVQENTACSHYYVEYKKENKII